MKKTITIIDNNEINCVSGAGEAGRDLGRKAAEKLGGGKIAQEIAGEVGSRIEDAVKDFFSPSIG